MSIQLRCSCDNDTKLTTKICPRCQNPFPKKGRRYKVVVRASGRKVTRTVGNLELAREIEGKLKVDIARGEHKLQKKLAPVLADVWRKYEPWAEENKPKSVATDQGYYRRHLKNRLEKKRLDNISPIDIERLMSDMRKGESKRGKPYSPTTIRHVVTLLSRLYTFAEERGLYLGVNPCRRVKKPTLNNQITEFLTDEELTRLIETLDSWPDRMSASFIQFLLYTGLRRGELFKLTWKDVDLDRQTISLRDPKGGKDTVLPLSAKAIQVLRDVPREYDTDYIFYGKQGQQRVDFKGPWERIKKASDLSGYRLHGLRHHFASSLVSSGVDLFVVSKLLTHKDIKTTQRYAHLSDKTLRDAVARSDELQVRKGAATKVVNLEDVRNG